MISKLYSSAKFSRHIDKSLLKPIDLSYSFTKSNNHPDKKIVVFLHGLFGNRNNFRSIASSDILKSISNPLIIDLRNHGSSEHSDTMSYSEMATDLDKLFTEKLKLDKNNKIILIGHSMGGKTAMTYAALFPEKLDGLLIIDSLPKNYGSNYTSNNIKAIVDRINSLNLSNTTRDSVIKGLSEEFGEAVGNLLNTNLINDPELKWRINVKSISNEIEKILGWEEVGEYHGPVKVLNGEKSNTFYDKDFKNIFPNIKNENIKVIKDAGHWVHYDKPKETLKEISEFIENLNKVVKH